MALLRIFVPAIALLLSAGLVLVWAYVRVFDVGGWPLQSLLFFSVAGACGLFFFWSSWPWVGMVVAMLIFLSVSFGGEAFHNAQLNAYGRSVECQVLDVAEQAYGEWVSDPNGGSHYERHVDYRHRLRCPPGGPTELSYSRILAKTGHPLRVVWDRTGRVAPLPASELRDSWSSWRVFLAMYGLALLILLAESVIDLVRYPRRSKWDFGGRGYMTGSFMNLADR